jgi:HSP20 family protein
MSLIKWTPFFFDEDNNNFFSDLMPTVQSGKNNFMPAIDMYEKDGQVIVETELAGMDPEKVDITIENGVLSLKGESEKKSEIEDKNYYRKEIRRGSFFRSIALPAQVEGEKATANVEDGLLKISIPKSEATKPKTIKINTKK